MTPVDPNSLQAQRQERESAELKLHEDMFAPQQPPDAATSGRLRLTPEGCDYYGAWWKRFGFALKLDADSCVDGESFFDTWQFIHRSQSQMPPDAFFSDTDLAVMLAAERELGESLNQLVRGGEEVPDLELKAAAAKAEREERTDVVLLFENRRHNKP